MAFEKGNKRAIGKGRPPGVANKNTQMLREMILEALDNLGGTTYLMNQAVDNPTAFMTLIGKVLPLQVTGENGGALVVTWEK